MQNPSTISARQICRSLKAQILDGVFSASGRLPSSRALAAELGVSRTTVTVAYEQLAAEGYIVVRQGARPQVAQLEPSPALGADPAPAAPVRLSSYGKRALETAPWRPPVAPLAFDFRYGDLAPSDFPTLQWKRAMDAVLAKRPEQVAYADPKGSLRLRAALQGYLWRSRMIEAHLDQIIVVNGSQQGLDLCARLLLDADDAFVVEEPCYAMARRIFASVGARPMSIAADQDGLDTRQLAGIKARLAYVTPSHQFPLGGVLPMARRAELLKWAHAQNAIVIEDDYDSEFRYDIDPMPALHGLQGGTNVVYVGTISKTLSPALRIGYLVAPPGLTDAFAAAKQIADRHTPTVEQEALANLLESGAYEAHVRKARRRNAERRRTLLEALQCTFGCAVTIEGADAGLHLVAWFDTLPAALEPALVEAARALGVGVYPIAPLYGADARPERVGLVLGYAAMESRRIQRGVELLAKAVQSMTSSPR